MQDDRGTVRPLADRHDSAIADSRDADETGDSARSGNDAPCIAVPVLGKRPQELVSHRPDIIGGDSRDCHQRIVALRVRVRAGDDAPARAIPVLDYRGRMGGESPSGHSRPRSHGPDVGGGERRDRHYPART